MHHTSTSSKPELRTAPSHKKKQTELQPQPETLKQILKFAATYRAEKISDNQSVPIILN